MALLRIMQEERRNTHRVEWNSLAIIYDRNGLFGRRCVVSNLSSGGATLIVAQPESVPDQCTMRIAIGANLTKCHVVWRTAEAVGVAFDESVSPREHGEPPS